MFVRYIWLGIFTWDQPAAVNETEEATAGVAGKGRSSRIVWLGQKSNQRSNNLLIWKCRLNIHYIYASTFEISMISMIQRPDHWFLLILPHVDNILSPLKPPIIAQDLVWDLPLTTSLTVAHWMMEYKLFEYRLMNT